MAKVLSSISGNLISAASAGYAPTNGADVSAIASAYQVVSATGTQTYAGTAYVTSLNSAPVSAERAGNAANAGLANSAWYDGTGRYISALPDSSTVSAIASSYAKSSVAGMSGQSSNWNSVYNTVSSNSASWSGGSQALTSPEGTIVISGGQLEGTNSAVLTKTTGGQEMVLGTTTNTIQGYQMTSLTTYMLGQTGFVLSISSLTEQYDTKVLISGWTQNGTYESASGAFPANGTLVKIPLGNIIGNISASANNWINMPGYEVTARLPGTVIVTGVGELAWASSVSGVSSTVYNNSANWAASGISSATCSSIASSYAKSAASSKQDSSAMSAYALSSDVSGVIDTVTGNSAAWSETAYIPLSSTAIEMNSTAYSATYGLESIDLFVKDADSSNVLIEPAGISFKSGNGTNIGFVDPYHIGNWDGVYNTVSTNSASWISGGVSTASATAYRQNGTQLVTFTGVASADSKPLIAQTIQAGAVQSIGTSNFFYGPSAKPFTANTAGIYSPLQYATGACLAMDGGTYRAYYKGNEWFISDYGTNRSGAVRAEVHSTRGIHISGSNTAGVGFDLLTSGLNFTNNTGTTSMTPANIAEWKSCNNTVSSNSAIWNSASAVSSCATTAYVESGLSGKQDVFSAGEGLEFVQSGSDTLLQVEAPVDIVAGPGIVIDNPDGNTLRVSQQYPTDETVLYTGSGTTTVGTEFNLSEAYTNFDHIRIYAARSPAGGHAPYMAEYMVSNTYKRINFSYVGMNDNDTVQNMYAFAGELSGTKMTIKANSTKGLTTAVTNSTASPLVIVKIAGVHRIAGGN